MSLGTAHVAQEVVLCLGFDTFSDRSELEATPEVDDDLYELGVVGVEPTAPNAHEHGFNVTLATDATTDTNPDAHANSIARIFPRLGETGTTGDILALLDVRD